MTTAVALGERKVNGSVRRRIMKHRAPSAALAGFTELRERPRSEPREKEVDKNTLDAFSIRLVESAKANGYVLHSWYGRRPRAILGDVRQKSHKKTLLAPMPKSSYIANCEKSAEVGAQNRPHKSAFLLHLLHCI